MKNFKSIKTSLATAVLLLSAVNGVYAAAMDKAAYKAERTRISADFKVDKASCGSMAGNAKDICMAQAKAKEKVAEAEAEYAYTGKPVDQAKIMKVKADTTYSVAKEKCDDQAGNAKDVCVKEAKAAQTKAVVDAKMTNAVGEAKMDGAKDKNDADYEVAAAKCDALAGDAKISCLASAKTKFGKS